MRGGALTQDQCRWSGQRLTLRVHVTLADDLEDAYGPCNSMLHMGWNLPASWSGDQVVVNSLHWFL